ncbi:hypothetical protein [Micromonospora matsumotoense]|uniref:hypothetical protein n=1 Tax=Micromonospora matsumotoense TaxID=121616 RepID=UPI0033F60086
MGNCWRDEPEILERPEPLDAMVSDWPLPALLGQVINLGLADDADGSRWLVLTAGGTIVALDPDDEQVSALATVELVDEPGQQPWMDRQLRAQDARLRMWPLRRRGQWCRPVRADGGSRSGRCRDARARPRR